MEISGRENDIMHIMTGFFLALRDRGGGGGGGILAKPKFYGGNYNYCSFHTAVKLLLQFCKECPAESVMGENVMMPGLVSSDLLIEWKAFRKYIVNEKKAQPFRYGINFKKEN